MCWLSLPDQEARLRERTAQDERFREVCADYGACLTTLGTLRAQGGPAAERVAQYRELRLEFEHELRSKLE